MFRIGHFRKIIWLFSNLADKRETTVEMVTLVDEAFRIEEMIENGVLVVRPEEKGDWELVNVTIHVQAHNPDASSEPPSVRELVGDDGWRSSHTIFNCHPAPPPTPPKA
jgi:hypothetical protein